MLRRVGLLCVLIASAANSQVIEFESSGLKYKALTRGGLTVMVATLHTHIRNWAILQIAVSNGSPVSWGVRAEDFHFKSDDGRDLPAIPARTVVEELLNKAGRGDVVKLITAYEAALNSNAQMHSTNGYESRRQSAQAELGSSKLKAAAAASAIAFVSTKLTPGQSTDGAVFYANNGKPLGAGQLVVNAAGETFVFPMEADPHASH